MDLQGILQCEKNCRAGYFSRFSKKKTMAKQLKPLKQEKHQAKKLVENSRKCLLENKNKL